MPTAERKRPWYLVMALLGALALGAYGASNGWVLMNLYREDLDVAQATKGLAEEADRLAVGSRFQALLVAIDAAKGRGWPLGIAMLLVGSAVVVFTMRALGGSAGARAVLVQLVFAQAGLDATHHWVLRDVERAILAYQEAQLYAQYHEPFYAQNLSAQPGRVETALLIPLALRVAGAALIVVALTRRRSRAFYEAVAATVEER
jgi:hypothetical protein